MVVRPGIIAARRRDAGAPAVPGDPTVYVIKHYVIAQLRDGLHVRALKHYVIAEPS